MNISIREYTEQVNQAVDTIVEDHSKPLFEAMKSIGWAVFNLREALEQIVPASVPKFGYQIVDLTDPEMYPGFMDLTDEEADLYYDAWEKYTSACETYEALSDALREALQLAANLDDLAGIYRTERSLEEFEAAFL